MPTQLQRVTLRPFTAAILPRVQPWFRHPEVRRRLGGPDWPARELRLPAAGPGEQYRGRIVLRVHSWVAVDDAGTPLAKIGCDVYDRWTRRDGSRPDQPVIAAAEPGPGNGLGLRRGPGSLG